jgi:hypothetical protein
MSHHTVTLNYGARGFRPDMDQLAVKQGDTISFQLGVAPPNSTFKITMNDPQFFSAAEVKDSQTTITVLQAAPTTYRCQLFDSGNNLLFESGEHAPGGGIRPDKT